MSATLCQVHSITPGVFDFLFNRNWNACRILTQKEKAKFCAKNALKHERIKMLQRSLTKKFTQISA